MRIALRWFATLLATGILAWWAAAGANPGWTKTVVPVKTLDEVTGIEGIAYEKRLVPGVDLLGASILLAGLSLLISVFFRTPVAKNHTPDPHA